MEGSLPVPLSAFPRVIDRRLTVRVAAIVPIEIVLSENGAVRARTIDIGMGGVCVATESWIDPRSIRAIRMTLGRQHIEVRVNSCWSSARDLLVGLIFEDLDKRSEAALWSFVEERARELAQFLRTCEGLDQLEFQELFELALTTRIRTFGTNDVIYGGGDIRAASSVFALFRGTVVLDRPNGQEPRQVISSVKPGELFGGLPAIAACVPFEQAVAVEESMVLEFLAYNVEYLLTAKPQLGVALLRAATRHWMRRFSETLDHLSQGAWPSRSTEA